MGKSIAKFIMMTTGCLILAFFGIWMFNHVNPWIGIFWLIAFIVGMAYLWADLSEWVHKKDNQQEK